MAVDCWMLGRDCQHHNLLLIQNIIIVIFQSLSEIIFVYILYKIICNLYTISCGHIGFSDRHTWIIEPSSANKIYALLSMTFMVLSNFYFLIMIGVIWNYSPDFSMHSTYFIYFEVYLAFRISARSFYFLYVISTLEYQRKACDLMQQVISNNQICFIKVVWCIYFLNNIVAQLILWAPNNFSNDLNGFPYVIIVTVIAIAANLIMETFALYLYTKGLNHIANYYHRRDREEFENYGTTERIHEALIESTTVTVMLIISFIANLLPDVLNLIQIYGLKDSSAVVWTIFDTAGFMFVCIDYVTWALSIYFIYKFGHDEYRKYCSFCHDKVYSYCKRRHAIDFSVNSYVELNQE